MRRRLRRKSKQIEISSLIDILFILLIFLMVSVRFTESTSRFEFNLPQADAQVVGDTEKETKISISKTGEHYLNEQIIGKENLYEYIRTKLNKDSKMIIVLELDVESKFGDFFDLTNLLKSKSIGSIQIVTKK